MSEGKSFLVLGGDKRMDFAADYLMSTGAEVTRLSEYAGDRAHGGSDVLLPVPLFKNGRLNIENMSFGEFLELCEASGRVFAGSVPENVTIELMHRGVEIVDLLKCEELTVFNAMLTAEGTVSYLLNHFDTSLCGKRILLTGYGRIGKMLAPRLRVFGTDITVAVRKPKDMEWIRSEGFRTASVFDLTGIINDCDIVINTVPGIIIGRKELSAMKKGAFVADLAAAPGGVDKDAAAELKADCKMLSGIPGLYAPRSAGEAIAKTFLDFVEGKN